MRTKRAFLLSTFWVVLTATGCGADPGPPLEPGGPGTGGLPNRGGAAGAGGADASAAASGGKGIAGSGGPSSSCSAAIIDQYLSQLDDCGPDSAICRSFWFGADGRYLEDDLFPSSGGDMRFQGRWTQTTCGTLTLDECGSTSHTLHWAKSARDASDELDIGGLRYHVEGFTLGGPLDPGFSSDVMASCPAQKAANSCGGAFAPCDKAPTGTWIVDSACVDPAEAVAGFGKLCPDQTVSLTDSNAWGAVTLRADGSYLAALALRTDFALTIPASCAPAGKTVGCTALETGLTKLDAAKPRVSARCQPRSAGGCDCAVTVVAPGHDWWSGHGTYSAQSGTLALSAVATTYRAAGSQGQFPYCATDGALELGVYLQPPGSTPGAPRTYLHLVPGP
jgi:hypothetical protein